MSAIFLVKCHDVQAPEQLALPGALEVCEQLGENGYPLMAELVVQMEERLLDFRIENLRYCTGLGIIGV